MASDVPSGEGDAAALQARAVEVVRAAAQLMEKAGGPDDAELRDAIEQHLGVERELVANQLDFALVFVHLGILLGVRCHMRRDSGGADAAERAEALRRLRWADSHGPRDDPLVVQARMMLLFVLLPWALPRTDGSRTALQNALLDAADGRVLTEALRRDLIEAREVVDRIAEAPTSEEFRLRGESIRQDIEQMLAAGSAGSARRSR